MMLGMPILPVPTLIELMSSLRSLYSDKMPVTHVQDRNAWDILYSRKFLLVQFFTDLPSRPSKEVFVVLDFAPALEQDHTHHR